jgi:hypothetical protein
VLEEWPASASAAASAAPLYGLWLDLVRRTTTGVPLCRLLRLGEMLGFEVDPDWLEGLWERELAPQVADESVRRHLSPLLKSRFGDVVLQGIGAYLEKEKARDDLFAGLQPFLLDPGVRPRLEEYCHQRRAVGLYCRLLLADPASTRKSRAEAFKGYLNGIKGLNAAAFSASDVGMVFRMTWPEGLLSVQECLVVLNDVPHDLLAKTSLPACFVRSFQQSGEQDVRARLAAALLEPPLRNALGASALPLEIWHTKRMLRDLSLENPKVVRAALVAAQGFPAEEQGAVLEEAARRLLLVIDVEHQADLLERGSSIFGRFPNAYAQAVDVAFRDQRQFCPELYVRILRVWFRCRRQLRREEGQEGCPSVWTSLCSAARRLPKDHLGWIDGELQDEAELGAKWRAIWRDFAAGPDEGSLFGRLIGRLRWLFPGRRS